VEAIHGRDKVAGVTLRDTLTGATPLLPTSRVFVAIGPARRNELINGVVDLVRKWVVSGQAKHPGGAQRSRDGL
jgi:thioredoxin reductase